MKIMELSGLELHCLIADINQKLSQGYYVGAISSISRNSLSLKMRHAHLSDVMLILSTTGIWITRMNFRTFEDSPIINGMKSEIERAKFESIEQKGDERIAYLKFRIPAAAALPCFTFFVYYVYPDVNSQRNKDAVKSPSIPLYQRGKAS